MTTTPTAISQEERAKLRNFEAGVGPYLSGRDFAAEIAPRLLDALEVAEAKNERYRKRIQSRFRQLDEAEARAVKAERERDAALEQNAAKIQAATVEILNGFTNAVAGTDGKKHFSVGITCPYCGFRSSSIEGAEAHDGQCEKHPGVMRAVKAERERNVLAREIMRRGEQSDYDLCPYDGSAKCLYPDSIPCHRSIDGVKECWLEWAEQQAACVSQVSDKGVCVSDLAKSETQAACSGCGGKGGLEYEPGLLTHVCRECSGTGKQTSQGEGEHQ